MFRKVRGFSKDYVNTRFEFFHHYWSTIKPKQGEIYFDEIRFESHRSIILKIENQLNLNFKYSYKWFKYLFIEHPFFEKANIIAERKSIQNYRSRIIKLIDPSGTLSEEDKRNNYISKANQIIFIFNRIKKLILEKEDYSLSLTRHLIQIISKNAPLESKEILTLKFLINSYIVELYHHGYNLNYISKIPDILLFKDHMNEFPFEKTLADFSYNKKQFEEYVKEQKSQMKLDKLLGGLINLINRPWKDGYFIFKINNLALEQPHPMEICGVTFYNPQITRMINLKEVNKPDLKEQYAQVEDFYYQKDHIDSTKLSRCNAIVKSKFKASPNNQSARELFTAYHKASKALDVLNNIINRYDSIHDGKGSISLYRNFQLYGNKKIAYHNFKILRDEFRNVQIKDIDDLKYLNLEVGYINKLSEVTNLSSSLFNIISTHNSIENNEEFFNFKDLWIAWEALLKKSQLIELAKTCFYIRYKINYLTSIKIFLDTKIKGDDFHPESEYYLLNKVKQKKIGLDIQAYKRIPTTSFEKNYSYLKNYIPIEMIEDLVKRIDEFLTNEEAFFNKLNKWVSNTIDEIYIERNMEVHSNLKNDLSKLKLQKDFIFISHVVVGFIIQYLDKRNLESLDLAIERIKKRKQKFNT